MLDPFWYTSRATGLQVDTGSTMDVSINKDEDGLGRFTVETPDTYRATVFVESTPPEAKPCEVTWWNGTAGIIDLANPDARAWYQRNLKTLMDTYDIEG